MKSMNAPRLAAFGQAGLIVTIIALTGCTAESTDTLAATGVTSTESGAAYCASSAPYAIRVKDADGHLVRLVRSPGYGWRYQSDPKAEQTARKLAFPQLDFSPILPAQALSEAAADRKAPTAADPLSVFIDGPTGYTFAWTGEGGWKFVGRISDERP